MSPKQLLHLIFQIQTFLFYWKFPHDLTEKCFPLRFVLKSILDLIELIKN
nr:MAG TPA: hypothetical protein [Caudoviricetes sp.]